VLFSAGVAAGCGGGHSKVTAPTTFTGFEKPYRLSARLNRAQEVPMPRGANDASGSFSATIKPFGNSGTFDWRLSYTGLSGRATAARVFLGEPGKTGVVTMNLCAPCNSHARGSVGANSALLQAVLGRPAYVNVNTKRNPRGEIRGRIQVSRPG
jgi:hypothetical protein